MPLSHSFWRRTSPSFPSVSEYMEIFPDCARIVSACVLQDDPVRYAPMAVTYEELEPGRVRTRLKSDSDWSECTFRMGEGVIYWMWGGEEWPWELISYEELPEWFRAFEAKARQRMDERDAAAAERKAEEEEQEKSEPDS